MNTKDWTAVVCTIITTITTVVLAIDKMVTSKKKTAKRVKPRKLKRKR